jgi:hypothetical protein
MKTPSEHIQSFPLTPFPAQSFRHPPFLSKTALIASVLLPLFHNRKGPVKKKWIVFQLLTNAQRF